MAEKRGRPVTVKLTCKEIIDIIKCGCEENVERLFFGGLSIQYQARKKDNTEQMEAGPLQDSELNSEVESFMQEQELALKEDELALMAIENPEEFEAALARGDLTES